MIVRINGNDLNGLENVMRERPELFLEKGGESLRNANGGNIGDREIEHAAPSRGFLGPDGAQAE